MEKNKKILIVDDNQKILDITSYFLKEDGYEVRTAIHPFKGLGIAKNEDVDLIILDVMMPDMDGYQVFAELKEDERTNDIPVILLTAKAVLKHTDKKFFYGLYAALSKPYSRIDLLTKVEEILKLTSEEQS